MAGLGRKTWTAGEVVTAANVQGYLQDQAVMVFAGTAARSSAIATATEGMVSYLSDTNVLQVYTGSTWDAVTPTDYIADGLLTATGDIIVASGSATPARLPIGSNGQYLTSNGTTATWVTPPSATGATNLMGVGEFTTSLAADTYGVLSQAPAVFGTAVIDSGFHQVVAGSTITSVVVGLPQIETAFVTTASGNLEFARTWSFSGFILALNTNATSALYRSTDGVTFTQVIAANITNVEYVNGKYIATNGGTTIYHSTDGITWTSVVVGVNGNYSVAFGASLWVAVGGSGSCYSSPDLVTWTSRSAGSTTFVKVIFESSIATPIFVAVGNTGTLYSSTNGTTWTSRTSTMSGNITDAVFAEGLFVIVGTSDAATSTNGTSWTGRTFTLTGSPKVLHDGTNFYAYTPATTQWAKSADGTTWTAYTGAGTIGNLVINGLMITSDTYNLYASRDGSTWLKTKLPTYMNGTVAPWSLAYLDGRVLALGNNGSKFTVFATQRYSDLITQVYDVSTQITPTAQDK